MYNLSSKTKIDKRTFAMSYIRVLTFVFLFVRADGVCNVDNHHPKDGGYYVEGIAAISAKVNSSLANNCRFNNTTSEMYFISNINQLKITAN